MLHHVESKWSMNISLITHYRALVDLCEMDQEIIEQYVFSITRTFSDRIVKSCGNLSLPPIDKIMIDRINGVISKYNPTAYRTLRSTPDDLEHFKEDVAIFYGHRLYTQVIQLRQPSKSTTQSTQPVVMNNLHNNESFYSTRSLSYSDMDSSQQQGTEGFYLSSVMNLNDNTYNHLETSPRSLSTNTLD
ncbi:unnamed protein product [Adineta steineri]|uniref:Uncharacterized protein n=1 Tax=Adineta steineri TaxID=433720 RepID=A0A816DL72_9BILA|nr:unnamed protein product [Adineta steineri]CAF1638855.1 unnamed protein product [Adineta steineri]